MVGNLIFQDIKQLWASQHSSMLLQRNGMTKTMCACEMLRSFKIKTFTFLIESDTDTTHISFFHCILILTCIGSKLYFNQTVFLCTDHRFIPTFFTLKSLIGCFSLNLKHLLLIKGCLTCCQRASRAKTLGWRGGREWCRAKSAICRKILDQV